MRINHNSLAVNASDHFATLNRNIAKSMERLSSGNKITSPADDAAGLAISIKMNEQIRGLNRAANNSNDGISVIQASEGGLEEMHAILGRMRELAVKAANDVNSEDDRDAIQEEIDALVEELNQIADTTAFNGQKLLDGSLSRRTLINEPSLSTTYVSTDVPEGIYEFDVTSFASQAQYKIGLADSAATITKEQEGSLFVNDFPVEIKEGMTMSEVYEALQVHLDKIDVSVMSLNADGTEADFTSGSGSVYFKTKGYGEAEKIEIKVLNPELAAVLGVNDGDKETGVDCEATLTVTQNGFKNSATVLTDGNKLTVTDRNGFEMDIEIDPEMLENGATSMSVTLEVLSAGPMVIQSGANSGEEVNIDIPATDAHSLGVDNLIMYTNGYASEAITAIDKAVVMISNTRSKLGAYENRLNDVYDNLKVQEESMTEAYSRIMDTDMAEEMTEYTQEDVLAQAAISMIQKSLERPESILQLLQQ